ncbi:MAG: LysM peptidoglycan-binding domain-containing protein, partial [Prevotellaceae bacterium]|nr:LysM peptidoglycan-binding domain-containing protein [Prevotellaceae bacterium]
MKIQTLLVAMLLLFSTYLSGQATKSLPRTRTSNGTECYVYTVQPHDNVGEISKKFGVSQDEIIKENPEAAKVIKVGFPLYVPVPQNLTKQRAAKPAIVPSPTAKSTVVASKPAATKSTATKPAAAASESAPKPTAVVLESVPKPAVVAPAQPTVAVSESAPKPTIAMGSVQFVQHEVEIGQTLFSLCKQFNISQEELMRYNPILERGLKSGQTLNIPVQSSLTQASNEPTFHVSTANNTKPTVQKNEQMTPQKAMALLELEQQKQQLAQPTYTTHIVKAKETLYSVSRLYGMYVEDIINANPTIESSLKVGQSLKIPSKTLYVSSPKTNETPNQPLKIAFLLPFFVGGSDAGNERFIEFYSGALIAINEAKRQGVSFEIYT